MDFIPSEIRMNHHVAQLLQRGLRLPAEFLVGLVRAADQQIHFGRTIELRIHAHQRLAGGDIDTNLVLSLPDHSS